MSHVANEKAKLLNRIKRLRGQIEAIERAVEGDQECADVLQQATSCRGALDGFIAEVIEDHIREHMVDPRAGRDDPRVAAAEELVEIVHGLFCGILGSQSHFGVDCLGSGIARRFAWNGHLHIRIKVGLFL